MRIAYFDCFSGISGDMCLGALVDAGISIRTLENELRKISVGGYKLKKRNVHRHDFAAKKVDVVTRGRKGTGLKRWKEIESVIQQSKLSEEIKQKGLRIFKRLFRVESIVHGRSFDRMHLHEIGSEDTIVDIFGTIIGLSILGIDKLYASPVNLGSGFSESDGKILPVPAPATAEILKNIPVYSRHVPFELTTPTGAAIIRELSSGFGDMPLMNIETIGIGAGNQDFKEIPNVLRLFIGEQEQYFKYNAEKVTVIETNIDDMDPQLYEYLTDRLLKAGALDVFITQVIMKKGRPGVKITVLSDEEQREDLVGIILKETSTIGLRYYETKRRVLQREIKYIDSEFGKVRVKFSKIGDCVLKAVPEYEDCRRIAKKLNIPLIEVMKRIKV